MKSKVTIQAEEITPAIAQKILDEQNLLIEQGKLMNRRISERRVNGYANAMKSGGWQLTHQGIAFDDQGCLIDGQHRLWAVVRSETTVPMMVARDVPSSNCKLVKPVDLIDQGYHRSVAQCLHVSHGYDVGEGKVLAACANYVAKAVDRTQRQHLDVTTVLALLKIYEPHFRAIWAISHMAIRQTLAVLAITGMVRASHKEAAEELAEGVFNGQGLKQGDPALVLARSIKLKGVGLRRNVRRDTMHFTKVVANSLYCQIKGIKMNKIQFAAEALEWLLEQQPENIKKVMNILHP